MTLLAITIKLASGRKPERPRLKKGKNNEKEGRKKKRVKGTGPFQNMIHPCNGRKRYCNAKKLK